METWVRNSIEEAVADYFGGNVRPDERAIQALSLTEDPGDIGAGSSVCVLQAALTTYPLLGNALGQAGADLSKVHFRDLGRYEDGWETRGSTDLVKDASTTFSSDLINAFTLWFEVGPELFTNTYLEVAESGTLSAIHIVRSCLENTWMEGGLGDDPPAMNDVAGELSVALGRGGKGEPLGWLDREIQHAIPVDRDLGSQQFILEADGDLIRVQPFGAFGGFQLSDEPLADGSLWIARGNVIQQSVTFTPDSLAELEHLINSDAYEAEFQRFFEDHPEYLLALGDYQSVHAQLVLGEDDGGRLIPDFFLEKYDSGMSDICDLKRANVELVRKQRNRTRFRDSVQEAVAQLRHYRDYFDDRDARSAFRSRYGLDAFRPRVVVIIGRRHSFESEIQRVTLEGELPEWVTLRTYDDVVDKARQWRRLVGDTR